MAILRPILLQVGKNCYKSNNPILFEPAHLCSFKRSTRIQAESVWLCCSHWCHWRLQRGDQQCCWQHAWNGSGTCSRGVGGRKRNQGDSGRGGGKKRGRSKKDGICRTWVHPLPSLFPLFCMSKIARKTGKRMDFPQDKGMKVPLLLGEFCN